MDLLTALVILLTGGFLGGMLQVLAQKYLAKSGLREYAKKIIIGSNSALQTELDYLKKRIEGITKELTEVKVEAAKLKAENAMYKRELKEKDNEIKELKTRLEEVERFQNGKNKNN